MIELPDFDVMMDLIDQIRLKSVEKGKLDVYLKTEEAKITKTARSDSKYFDAKGQPLAQTAIDNLYKYSGFENELLDYRLQAEVLEAEIAYLKSKLDFYKTLVDIWRTQAANERMLAG